MSDFSTILARVRSNLALEGVRYVKTSSTLAGATDGTTIISTNLFEINDEWNDTICHLLSGTYAGQKRHVEDFVSATGQLSFTNNPWPLKVATGIEFELIEDGIWQGDDLKRFIEQAGNWILRKASDLNINFTVRQIIGSASGVCELPGNVLKFVDPIVKIDGKVATIIPPHRASQFDDDPFIDAVNGDPIAYFWGRSTSSKNVGQLIHKPATNASCEFNFVPVASFDTDGAWKVPEEAWDAISQLATGLALQANERPDLAKSWIQMAFGILPREKDLKLEETNGNTKQ